MSQSKPVTHSPAPVLELKAGAFSLLSLRLSCFDLDAIRLALAEKIAQAPRFFEQASIVIEPAADTGDADAGFWPELFDLLRGQGLQPLAVHGGQDAARAAAQAAGLAVIRGGPKAESARAPRARGLRVIDRAVRSGQQIHAAGADLVVLGAVSAGAEILADGHIHVYGPLRGRALAGLDGDSGARIFCQRLEAELVSVAGNYRVLEEIDPRLLGGPAQIYFDGERLCMESTGANAS